jgi:hypothetical protein
MSAMDSSRQAMRGDDDALARLIRNLADDLYECRPSDLLRTRAELERRLQASPTDGIDRSRELKALWELTHVFLSKIPLALQTCLDLGSESVESTILSLIESDDALTLDEISVLSDLDEDAVRDGLRNLERLGLIAPLVGEALRLTRDGREVKRWFASRDAAGKSRTGVAGEPTPAATAEPKDASKASIEAVHALEAARRLVASFDTTLRAKLRQAEVRSRRSMNDRRARQQDFIHKQSLLRIAGSELQVLKREEVRQLEGKVARGTEVWVIGVTPPNGEAFFDVVASNLIHSQVRYFYVCPEPNFRELWTRLAEKCGEEQLRHKVTCIMNAPELMRLDTARIHVHPDGKIRLMRACALGSDKSESVYLVIPTPTAFPYVDTLRSYRRASSNLVAKDPAGRPVLDFQRLEMEVRSIGREGRPAPG